MSIPNVRPSFLTKLRSRYQPDLPTKTSFICLLQALLMTSWLHSTHKHLFPQSTHTVSMVVVKYPCIAHTHRSTLYFSECRQYPKTWAELSDPFLVKMMILNQ